MGHLGGEHLERAPRRGAVLDGLVRRARLRRADAVPAWVKRMPTPDSDTPARSKMAIDRLIARRDVHPREKTLWRMLYETCARCEEILDVSIEELDLAGRRAPVKTKGAVARRRGGRGREDFVLETVYWDAGTARLLPRLIKGRTRGQVFVTRRSPGQGKVVAPRDACPDTGLARADGSSRLGGGGRFRRRPAAAPAPPRKWILPALLATCLRPPPAPRPAVGRAPDAEPLETCPRAESPVPPVRTVLVDGAAHGDKGEGKCLVCTLRVQRMAGRATE